MADLHWGFESTDTSVQERSSRGKHYTQDTALLLTVGANETATINEIFLHARSNSANWVVLFSIYSCDSNGNPSTSIWNGTSDPVPGNGSRTFYCATGGVQLTAGNYILALTPTSGSVLDLYVTGPAGGEIMQGIQADNSLDWVEDTADKLLVNKNHFWAKGTIESSVEPPPDGTWGRPYEEDTTTLENSLRDYTYTQNSDLILNVGAGQSVLVDDIYLHARSNGANWQVVLAIYTCDANGLPDQPVWNSLSNSAPKAGAFVFTADAAGLRLEEGNYTLCWAPYTGSVLDVYNTTLASGTIYQGGQDDTNQPWEDDVERHLFGDVRIWADIRGDLGSGNAIDDVNGNNEVVIGEDIIINGTFNSPLQSVEIIGEYTTGCVIGTSDSDSIECWPMAFAAWRCKIGGAGLVLRVNFSNGDPSVEIPVVLINESGWKS